MGEPPNQNAFIAERVRALATMYLTRRSDLVVKPQESGGEWVDYLVEIDQTRRKVCGVELKGTLALVSDEQANKLLHPCIQSMRKRADFPFPVCLFYFTMENNEGRYTWVAEPRISKGKPVLERHDEADTKKLDKKSLDQIVDKINKDVSDKSCRSRAS